MRRRVDSAILPANILCMHDVDLFRLDLVFMMSRRKQANPNRVAVVGAAVEDLNDGGSYLTQENMAVEKVGDEAAIIGLQGANRPTLAEDDALLNVSVTDGGDMKNNGKFRTHSRKMASPKKAVAALAQKGNPEIETANMTFSPKNAKGGRISASESGDGANFSGSDDVESQDMPRERSNGLMDDGWGLGSDSGGNLAAMQMSRLDSSGNSMDGSESLNEGFESSVASFDDSVSSKDILMATNGTTANVRRGKKSRTMSLPDMQTYDSDEDWDITSYRKKKKKSYASNRGGKRRKKSKPPGPGELDESDKGEFKCQICSKSFVSAHEFTSHIRQHNPSGTHGCKICGKKLSSTSSLDRHMLVHSGERPFKCKICRQAFTTNGNMYRHMRIHEKDNRTNDVTVANDYSVPRLKLASKRRRTLDSAESSSSPTKMMALDGDGAVEKAPGDKEKDSKEELSCPVCSKTFLCKYGLQTHMEIHPMLAQRCTVCDCAFKTPRGLRMHTLMAHKNRKVGLQPSGPAHVPVGFQDLGFAEFSSAKFPLIAKTWCEKHVRRCSSTHHRYVCRTCNKAFPCSSALDLHVATHSAVKVESPDVDDAEGNRKVLTQQDFMSALKLQPQSAPPEKLEETKEGDGKPNQYIIIIRKPSPANSGAEGQIYQMTPPAATSVKEENAFNTMKSASGSEANSEDDFADVQQILKVATSSANPMCPTSGYVNTARVQRPMPPLRRIPRMARRIIDNRVLLNPPPPPPLKCLQPKLKQELLLQEPEQLSPVMLTPENLCTQSVTPEDLRLQNSEGEGEESQGDDILTAALAGDLTDEKVKKKGNKKYACKYCNEVFPLARALKSHVRSHFGLTPYKCTMCSYSSADKSTLIRHMRTHNGERPFMCTVCEFAFTTKANCERHVRKKHAKTTKAEIDACIAYNQYLADPDGADTFHSPDTICKYCNKDFKFFRALRHHLRSHSSCREKPFHCKLCNNGFSTKNNCIRHILKRHRELSQMEVEASVMFHEPLKWANIASELEKKKGGDGIVVKEEPLDGDTPLDFSIRSSSIGSDDDIADSPMGSEGLEPMDLSLTKKENMGETEVVADPKKFLCRRIYHRYHDTQQSDVLKCPHCNLHFTKQSMFKEHVRTHNSERPFRCYYCSAAFAVKYNLEKHLEKRHQRANKKHHHTFLPTIIYPAQHKLLTKAARPITKSIQKAEGENFGVEFAAQVAAAGMSSPGTPAKKKQGGKPPSIKSPSSSMGSDCSGDLASVSKMLAATNCNNFETFLLNSPETTEKKEVKVKEESLSMSEPPAPPKSRTQVRLRRNSFPNAGSTVGTSHKLSCPYCPRLFPWISSLRRHILTHTGVKPFKCPQCGVYFSTKSNCERHMLRKHCNNNSADASFRSYTERPFKCQMCMSSSFSTRQRLRRHYMMKHPGAPIPDYEGIEDIQPEETPIIITTSADTTADDVILPQAKQDDLDDSLKETDFVALSNELSKTNSEVMAKVVKVDSSESGITVQPDMKVHITMMDEDQGADDEVNPDPLICNESIDDDDDNNEVEEKIVHVEENPCPKEEEEKEEEDKTKTEEENLNVTNKEEEEEEEAKSEVSASPNSKGKKSPPKISCEICGKEFKYSTTLTRHMRIHTLAHPFKCTECTARFTTKFNCQRHIIKIHGKSKEEVLYIPETLSDDEDATRAEDVAKSPGKADNGDECKSGDADPGGINFVEVKFDKNGQSRQIPENYGSRKKKCEICQKRFWSKQELQRHLRTHSQEKPFPCDKCDRSFAVKHSLLRHLKSHQDDGVDEENKAESAKSKAGTPTKRGKRKTPVKKGSKKAEVGKAAVASPAVDGLDPGVIIVNPESPPETPVGDNQKSNTPWDADATIQPDGDVYMTTAAEDRSMLMQASSEPDMFSAADEDIASSMDNSDIIQNLLGIHDSSVIDQMLDSADSAAKLLGVEKQGTFQEL